MPPRIFRSGPSTAANEYLKGSFASDTFIITGNEAQEIYAGHRDDIVALYAGDDYARGGGGSDLLVTSTGNNVLYGAPDHDTLIGGDGDNMLFGGKGND